MEPGRIINQVETVIKGKRRQVELTLVALLAKGHVLIEDIPGIGKTTLALAFARATGLEFTRIQFTSDLLPADIIGAVVFNRKTDEFEFRKGPIFKNIILADEINRATPKTQSALLEAMGEGQVSVEGVTYRLPEPFLVIATQNPVEHFGTFPLPESQLDRFMLRFDMGYPDEETEKDILKNGNLHEKARNLEPVVSRSEILKAQEFVENIKTAEKILEYVMRIVLATRDRFIIGMSTRAALDLVKASKAYAFIRGRDYVVPDDVKTMARYVAPHRLLMQETPDFRTRSLIFEELLNEISVPV